jgi:uncharacterized membrane protein YgdD (TMEM256/DUF423 family)
MARWLISSGALLCALAVAAGAFGAHGLAARLSERSLELWETASKYLIYGGFGVVLTGLVALHGPGRLVGGAGGCLLAGSVIFSGTVFALALGGPRWLGAVTPIGGLLLIAGFVLLAVGGWRG